MKYKTILTKKGSEHVRLTLTPEEAEDLFTLVGALGGGSGCGATVRETTNDLWDLLESAGFVEQPGRLTGVTL